MTYQSYSVQRGEGGEGKKDWRKKKEKSKKEDGPYLRPKRRTPLRFDQIHEGPQDPFCANAQGNIEEDRGMERRKRWRRTTGNVRVSTER